MHATTKGEGISTFRNAVEEYGGFEKLSAVCTDGGRAMIGTKIGFVGLMKENKIDVPTLHCVVHQEALCVKSITLIDAMATVTKINFFFIRGGNSSHSQKVPCFF